ncbi:hypothetical protein C0995_012764 [Termitomyces sp. Mi166|nr:hypothetical protein C0995_012764 [Termitomyces sp. Mi166\
MSSDTQKVGGKEGTITPSEEIFKLTFQLAVSLGTCRELAEDNSAVTVQTNPLISTTSKNKSKSKQDLLIPRPALDTDNRLGSARLAMYIHEHEFNRGYEDAFQRPNRTPKRNTRSLDYQRKV